MSLLLQSADMKQPSNSFRRKDSKKFSVTVRVTQPFSDTGLNANSSALESTLKKGMLQKTEP